MHAKLIPPKKYVPDVKFLKKRQQRNLYEKMLRKNLFELLMNPRKRQDSRKYESKKQNTKITVKKGNVTKRERKRKKEFCWDIVEFYHKLRVILQSTGMKENVNVRTAVENTGELNELTPKRRSKQMLFSTVQVKRKH